MKTPMVDYRKFRPNKLNTPEFSHLKLLLTWLIYFTLYFITETFIPAEKCTPIHIPLDDLIPFCEWFVIPYVFWYGLIVFSLGYFLLYDVDSFRRMQIYIFTTQMIAMVFYIFYPSRQDLRPEVFPRENVLTWLIGTIYNFDTNTGVLPSLHCGYSLGILSAWLRRKPTPLWGRIFVTVTVILVCMSTAFIKQHSAADFFAVLPVCLVAEILSHTIVSRRPYNPEPTPEQQIN